MSSPTDPPRTFADLLVERRFDPNPGLLFEDECWTWAEFVVECQRRALLLDSLRVSGPFHVGVLLDNLPEYLFLVGGAALCGAAIVGINPTRRGEQLARDIRHTDCQLIITDRESAADVSGLDTGVLPDRHLTIDSPSYQSTLDGIDAARWVDREVDPSTLLLLLFTSGTTGDPKAVRCSTGRLLRTALNTSVQFGITADDVTYQTMPLFHGNALMANFAPAIRSGATVAMRRKFSASAFLPDVRRYGATFFNYVGKALTYVLATPELPDDAENPLQRCFGNEASHRDIEAFERRFGARIIEGYGSSEGGAVITLTPDTPPGALGVGREGVVVLDPATRIERERARFDAHGRLLNADQAVGEIANLLGAPGFEGYYNNPAADAERVRDGIYWSGDLGYRDVDGYFWFAGRGNDWLRVDGENFAAAPVERILHRYPTVITAAVYAVPDPMSGDAAMAVLQLTPGASFDTGAFAAFLDAQPDLGTKWAPRFVRITEVIPTTGSLKVQKQDLRRDAWGCSDPVYVRSERGPISYELLDSPRRNDLASTFRHHGREALLPPGIRGIDAATDAATTARTVGTEPQPAR